MIAVPDLTVKTLATELKLTNYQVTKNGTSVKDTEKIGTGYIVKNLDTKEEKTIIVKGDVNGDGEVDTGDTFLLKLIVLGQRTLDTKCFKVASDVNGDGSTDTGDTFLLKKQVLNVSNITL